MAKNKNQKTQPSRGSAAEQGPERSKSGAEEAAAPTRVPGSPADMPRKHQRRFGHN